MSAEIPFGARSTADDVLANVDLAGRTVLVTGCNSGIGFETMRALASHGAHVLGLARTREAAVAACARVGGSTTAIGCDLRVRASVVEAAAEVLALGRRIDALVANAGIMAPKKLTLIDGVEAQLAVNHLGHFLLVTRLLDRVRDETGRIVIVSSSASVQQAPAAGIDFDNLDASRGYKPFACYGQSKLANALFAKELSRRVAERGISVNSLHPGAVRSTGLQRNIGFPLSAISAVAQLFMKTVPQGAATQTMLAASPFVQTISGEYWADCQIAKGSPYLDDAPMAARLWRVSEELLQTPTPFI